MSCHNVGRALNNVVREVMNLYDAGDISKDAAKRLALRCCRSVAWCDGSEGEAIDYISACVCGRCFKLIPKGEPIYSTWQVSSAVPNQYEIKDENGDELPTDGLCEECFDIVLDHHCGEKGAGKRERDIQKKFEDCVSTGEYKDDNNGCRWVD